jgi:hypothetical protein
MSNRAAVRTINANRSEFIEALSQEFLTVKGYGVYAHLSAGDVIRLFEQFRDSGIPPKTFAKDYVRSF